MMPHNDGGPIYEDPINPVYEGPVYEGGGPLYGHGTQYHIIYNVQERLDLTTRLLCEICGKLKKAGAFDTHVSAELKEWYADHLIADQKRLEDELEKIKKEKHNTEKIIHERLSDIEKLEQKLLQVRQEMGEEAYQEYEEKLANKKAGFLMGVESIKQKLRIKPSKRQV